MMYLKQKKSVYIREFEGKYGYIDNMATHDSMVLDEVGSLFLKEIKREPVTFERMYERLKNNFKNVDEAKLKNDAEAFYIRLVDKGFLTIGKTEKESIENDKGFKYDDLFTKRTHRKEMMVSSEKQKEDETIDFFNTYFPNNPTLLSLQIECASTCNERCIHCYIPHSEKIKVMKDSLFQKIIEEAAHMGVISLTLSGGEPMSNPHFAEWLRRLQRYDFHINILSNLTLLNDEILTEMKKMNSISVQVSLYSMNPKTHDAITQLKGSYFKTMESIFKLYEADIPLQISCPSMRINKDDYKDVLNWAHALRMKAATDYIIMARSDHSTDNLANRLTLEETENTIRDIVANDEEYRELLVGYLTCEKKTSENFAKEPLCGVGIDSLNVSATGQVVPCSGWWDEEIGNLNNDSLENIWKNSERLNELRNLRKKDIPKCLDCKDRDFCAICMAKNANENEDHDPLTPAEHFCKVAEINHKVANEYLEKYQCKAKNL